MTFNSYFAIKKKTSKAYKIVYKDWYINYI